LHPIIQKLRNKINGIISCPIHRVSHRQWRIFNTPCQNLSGGFRTNAISLCGQFIFICNGRLTIGLPTIIDSAQGQYADPLPQALVLTAIVIAFGMTAFLIVLALKARAELGNDHVDGINLAQDEASLEHTLPPQKPNKQVGKTR